VMDGHSALLVFSDSGLRLLWWRSLSHRIGYSGSREYPLGYCGIFFVVFLPRRLLYPWSGVASELSAESSVVDERSGPLDTKGPWV
jgi:hypothetical protein